MRKYILGLLLLISITTLANNPQRELFRGGMFLHTGYVKNKLNSPSVNGLVTGIGGKITFRLGEHFRAGTEGYVSNYGYGANEGQYSLGWGGLLAEYQFNDKRVVPVMGITIGGAKIRDLYMLSGNFNDNLADVAIYKVYSSFILAPQFGLEIRMSDHISLTTKVDYVLYPGIDFSNEVAKGPRFYFGIMFMR
ncbi:MAG TPA: hypothetical protein VJY41_13095 [Prolixibacteraceae bacterium]|nr:hypothetical protein [Prolixibacteraceae bacterium]